MLQVNSLSSPPFCRLLSVVCSCLCQCLQPLPAGAVSLTGCLWEWLSLHPLHCSGHSCVLRSSAAAHCLQPSQGAPPLAAHPAKVIPGSPGMCSPGSSQAPGYVLTTPALSWHYLLQCSCSSGMSGLSNPPWSPGEIAGRTGVMRAVFGGKSCRNTQERRSQLSTEGYSSSVPWKSRAGMKI